jgi:AAA family ATP:ADP antiporter
MGQFIGEFHADLDFWQNVTLVLIQLLLVSRIFKYLGVDRAVYILPAIALCGYAAAAAAPVLALIRIVKIGENATDYSLQNTLRRALFLPTSREAKYKALQAVETFFWRAGDMLSGLVTLLMVEVLGFGARNYALANVALAAAALVTAAGITREYRKLSAQAPAEAA